jgi:hypothetical protein
VGTALTQSCNFLLAKIPHETGRNSDNLSWLTWITQQTGMIFILSRITQGGQKSRRGIADVFTNGNAPLEQPSLCQKLNTNLQSKTG